MDDRICCICNLAVYLELYGNVKEDNNSFVYGNGKDGDRKIRQFLNDIYGNYVHYYYIFIHIIIFINIYCLIFFNFLIC